MEIILLTLAYYHGIQMPTGVWIFLIGVAIFKIDINLDKYF